MDKDQGERDVQQNWEWIRASETEKNLMFTIKRGNNGRTEDV